jgi:hypothetical protein
VTFVNPYNFIPAPTRPSDGDLADGEPPGHHRYHADRWTGRIRVTMTTATPLLLGQTHDDAAGHRQFHVPAVPGPDGADRVDLAPTQLKGMLRAAYEAVTNSRFGVLAPAHATPLGYRAPARSGSDLTPALVVHPQGPDSAPVIRLLGRLVPPGVAPAAVLPAAGLRAWTPSGPPDDRMAAVSPEPMLTGVAHGLHVEATLTLDELPPPPGEHRSTLWRWAVHQVVPASTAPPEGLLPPAHAHSNTVWARVRGYLHITGPTISTKRWERLFVTDLLAAAPGVVLQPARDLDARDSAPLLDALRVLIDHQREFHTSARGGSEIATRTDDASQAREPWEYFGKEPGHTAWARHLYDAAGHPAAPTWTGPDLTPGKPAPAGHAYTCWAENAATATPTRLRPVMVSRLRYDRAPADLVGVSLHPATSLGKASPADRVFGWVESGAGEPSNPATPKTAYRGHLRVVRVTAPTVADAVVDLDPPVILPPLATPKPSQGRFYLGDTRGPVPGPLPPGTDPAYYFADRHVPRGRKTYLYRRVRQPHADLPGGLPRPATTTPSGVRFAAGETTQTTTVHGWIAAGATFGFDLVVDNLSSTDLGALLWLLDPQQTFGAPDRDGTWQPGHLRLGLAKPFGYGVVAVAVDPAHTHLARGELLALHLANLDPEPPNDNAWQQLAAAFEANHPQPAVLLAARNAAVGVGARTAVHYPKQNPDDPGYDWFVKNDDAPPAVRQVLPALTDPAWPVSLRPVAGQ